MANKLPIGKSQQTIAEHLRDMLADELCYGEMTGYQVNAVSTVISLLEGIPLDRLEEICNAERDGRCLSIPKDAHQPMFVKADAVDTFDKWNDVTGAIPNGISWYYEAEAVIEEIAAMAFGCGIFYEAERKAAEAALKERE